MEVLARDLKALGLYAARSLSYEGVEYELLEHQLTAEQTRIYDAYAGAFRIIHNNLDAALRATNITDGGGTLNAQAKSAARSAFESAKQRFFNHLITAMKTPTLIAAIERSRTWSRGSRQPARQCPVRPRRRAGAGAEPDARRRLGRAPGAPVASDGASRHAARGDAGDPLAGSGPRLFHGRLECRTCRASGVHGKPHAHRNRPAAADLETPAGRGMPRLSAPDR
jgi:hypothetical protein